MQRLSFRYGSLLTRSGESFNIECLQIYCKSQQAQAPCSGASRITWPPDMRARQAQTLLRAALPLPTAPATLVIQAPLAGRARPARQAHTRHSRAQELAAAALWVCGNLQSPEVENGLKPSDMCHRESRQAPTRRRVVTPPRTALAMWATLALLEAHARRARPARTRHRRVQELAAAAPRVSDVFKRVQHDHCRRVRGGKGIVIWQHLPRDLVDYEANSERATF